MHACIEWAGRDAPGTYDLATRLLPVSGLSASGRSENLKGGGQYIEEFCFNYCQNVG